MRPQPRPSSNFAPTQPNGPVRPGFSPIFFDANGNPSPIESSYHGCHAFLLLNGPSAAKAPLEALKGCYVMTVNNGPSIFRSSANVMVDPANRFSMSQWLDPMIQKFVPQTHHNSPLFDNRKLGKGQKWEWTKKRVSQCPNVIYFRRKDTFNAETFVRERSICWGSALGGEKNVRSVMFAALRILVALGFKEIYLIGADFAMNAKNRYAFKMEPNEASAKGNARSYALLNEAFTKLQPELVKAGINVWNCTHESKLTAFPKMNVAKAIATAKAEIGDWNTEKLVGMYDDESKRNLLKK